MSGKNLPAVRHRSALALWVAKEILPHEPRVRHWLRRRALGQEDVEDLLQEAYCRIAMLNSVGHIEAPDAYFFSIVRNLLLRRLKRRQIVPLETIAEIECYQDERPSPEQVIGGKLAYDRMLAMIAQLPERCQNIVRLRKIEGWSQREIAAHLGITEKAVEKQVWLGIRLVRQAWSSAEWPAQDNAAARIEGQGR